jgi:hypothetical protein
MLFLFNVVGYYGVFIGLRYQSNLELKENLDLGAYQETDMLTLKLPYALPYQMESREYERIDGEFEHNGQFYNLVKHKVERDTLYIMYMKDTRETGLFETVSDFVQSTTDSPASKNVLKFIESLVKDYIPTNSPLVTASAGWCQQSAFPSGDHAVIKLDGSVFSPPPDIS